MSGSRSIITVILRQKVNRAAGAVRRANSMRDSARATERSVGRVDAAGTRIIKDAKGTTQYYKTSARLQKDVMMSQGDLNILLQSQSLRILTMFQMTRFMVQDLEQIMDGEDVFINMVSLGTSALLTAFQVQAVILQNTVLQENLNSKMAYSGIAGMISSINPAYMALGMVGVAGLAALSSGGSSNSKRSRDIQIRAARSIYG